MARILGMRTVWKEISSMHEFVVVPEKPLTPDRDRFASAWVLPRGGWTENGLVEMDLM